MDFYLNCVLTLLSSICTLKYYADIILVVLDKLMKVNKIFEIPSIGILLKLLTLRVNNVPTFVLSVKDFFNICLRYKEMVSVMWGLSLLRSNAATNNLAEIKALC